MNQLFQWIPAPRLGAFALVVGVAGAAASSAHAALVAYEPFNYTSGQSLGGQTGAGSTGFSNAWSGSVSSSTSTISGGTISMQTGSLSSSMIPTAGNQVFVQPTSATTGAFRTLSNTFSSGTTYISFLAQLDSGGRFIGLSLYDNTGVERLLIGKQSSPQTNWSVGISANIATTTAPATTLSLLVARITWNSSGNETIRLYVNPGATEPGSADATLTSVNLPNGFNQIRVAAGYDFPGPPPVAAATTHMDEIRIGSTYADALGRAGIGLAAGAAPTIITGGTATFSGTATNTNAGSFDLAAHLAVSGAALTPGAAGTGSVAALTSQALATTGTSTTIGTHAVTLTLSDTTSGANAPVAAASSFTVLNHANADFANFSGDAAGVISNGNNTLTIDFGTVDFGTHGGFLEAGFDLNALVTSAGFTARLDLDSITGSGNVSQLFRHSGATTFSNVIAGSLASSYVFRLNTNAAGVWSAQYLFNLSDENLSGAATQTLTLHLMGEVLGAPVPEPSTWALLFLGGAGFGLTRRWRSLQPERCA